MNPFSLLEKYQRSSKKQLVLLTHSVLVTAKALKIARKLKGLGKNPAGEAGFFDKKEIEGLDLDFVYEAAILHDIGFGFPDVKGLKKPKGLKDCYVAHAWWGAEILRKEGLEAHARVAERHVGVGLTKEEVEKNRWPIPARDYLPKTLAEKIISYADLYYSKSSGKLLREESEKEIEKEIRGYSNGARKVKIFREWKRNFS